MRTILITLTALGLWPAAAHAQDSNTEDLAAPSSATAPERVTMPAKRVAIHAHLEINLSADTAFEPTSLAPDAWYGVNDDLTVGLVHSATARSGVVGGAGSSLCLTGSGGGCAEAYRGFGLEARYQLLRDKISLAADGGLHINHFDPFQLALKLGVVGRWRPSPQSKLAVDFSPSLFFGFTERDSGNKEVLVLPGTVMYAVAPKISLAAQTGLVLPFADAGDTFAIPLSLGASYQLNHRISLDVAFSLPALIGGDQITNGFDARTLTLGGGYAL
ncbi:MAG: hypothetical protein R3B48_25430 [Kofleriaceae bacterium]